MIKKNIEILMLEIALNQGLIMLSKSLEKKQEKYENTSYKWLEIDTGEDFSGENSYLETLVNSFKNL